MFLFGVLIGLFEIVAGIITLIISMGELTLVFSGIIYILSGLLFLWLCYGVQTAYDNQKKVSIMQADIERLTAQNKSLEEEVERLKSDKEQESK